MAKKLKTNDTKILESWKHPNTTPHKAFCFNNSGLNSCQVQDQQQQTWPGKTAVTVFQRHYALCDLL